MIDMATGAGKTSVFSETARREDTRGGHTLVLAHRRELVDQAAGRLREFGLEVSVGLERVLLGLRYSVIVATVQSVRRQLERLRRDAFTLIICDECHHAPAPGWLACIEHFRSGGARVLGATATADRADGVSLGTVFERCSAQYGVRQAVEEGYLVPARGVQVEVEYMDLSSVRTKTVRSGTSGTRVATANGGAANRPVTDLHQGDLGKVVVAPLAIEGVVGPLMELAESRRTIVFAVNCAHAFALAASMNAHRPDCARVVVGQPHMHPRQRAANLAAHAAGEYQFLVNVYVTTEGYDDPPVECVAMVCPTKSRIRYTQSVGRGMRLSPGKNECLVLDFVGVSCQHDLVGPEDALAGALLSPVVRYKTKRGTVKLEPYNPIPTFTKFAVKAIELLRRGARRIRHAVPTMIGKVAHGARRIVAHLATMMLG